MRVEANACFSVWRGCGIKYFHLVVLLSVLGGFFKIVSGVFFGSKAALVDALTSIVNVVAALVVAKYESMSLMPPDTDHHYGHKRMFVGGSMFSISLYSVVGGAMLVDLIYSGIGRYEVHILATVFATLGALPYLTAILISKKMGGSFGTYAKFTMVEIIECLVVITSSLGGAIVNYLIDLTGASFLLIYLYVEIVREVRNLLHVISDKAPIYLTEKIRKISEDLDIEIRSIRVREVVPGKYHGDMVIALPAETTIRKAHEVADTIETSLKALGIDVDLVVHVEPA